GEFKTLVSALGGQSISLDGSDGIINPLQIYRADDKSNYKEIQASFEQYEKQCFMQHISKVAIFYEFLAGSPSTEEIEEFKKVLRMFYESLGFMEKLKTKGVTTLKNGEYPIFSDLLKYIRKQLYDNPEKRTIRPELSISRVDRLEKIELVVDNLVNSYASLFNGHTTIQDITDEQVIFFSIRNLTKLEKNVFQAQMYNTLNLIWDNLIQVGARQMKQMYQNEMFDPDEAVRFLIMIDEAHRLVNAENLLAVSFLTDFAREARKYFGGMILASQSIRDFVPDNKDTATVTKIRTLFELTQYKFVMQQDSNTLDSLRTIFEGQLTESELEHVPQLQQGECLLSISGVGNIMLSIEASEEELKLFRGGRYNMQQDNHEKRMFYKFIFLLVVAILIAIVYIWKWTADDSKEQDPKEMFQKKEQQEDINEPAGLDEDKINNVLTDDEDKNTEAQGTDTKEDSKQNEHTENNQEEVDLEQNYINQYSEQEVEQAKEQAKKVLALYLLQVTD